MKISSVHARQILDSRGLPTIEVDVILADGTVARAAVPSGASTGSHEAVELRDKNPKQYFGKSVLTAVRNVNEEIAKLVIGMDADKQRDIDHAMIELDGTDNKSKLGANAILGVSMAVCRAAALSQKSSLYQWIGQLFGNSFFFLPRPMILLMEGGKHGNWSTDIQEYMILPKEYAFATFGETIEAGVKVFYALEKLLNEKKYSVGVGFEGAFCPRELSSNEEALALIRKAVEKAGYKEQFDLALDGAASEFFETDHYVLRSEGNKTIAPREWSDKIIGWTKEYPIISLEDMHYEDLWSEWSYLTSQLGSRQQIVGDDLVTTNLVRIQKAIDEKAINSVLIKLNQIGTVTETLDAIALTQKAGFVPVISHRSGETNDDFAADLAVGTGSKEVKFGGPDRGERIAKYNQLLRIEEKLRK